MHLRDKDRHYLRVKGWKTIFKANGLKKQAGVAILISNKIDIQHKVMKKDKEGHFILVKIYQDKLSFKNIYAPNASESIFIKETLVKLKGHIAKHTNRRTQQRREHPTLINGQILETETKQRHSETSKSYETSGFNR
jgi:exonuclease III